MKMRTLMTKSICILALAGTVSTADAGDNDRFWINGLGGDFDNLENWLDGFDLGLPGDDDTAIFEPQTVYMVTFPQDFTNQHVLVTSGFVTFDLQSSTYTLLGLSPNEPSMLVGGTDVGVATLTITDGVLNANFAELGFDNGSFGQLTVTGAQTELVTNLQLTVGNQGAGILIVNDGAAVSGLSGVVAAGSGSFGDVVLNDPDTVWTVGGTLTIGGSGFALMAVENGAQLMSGAAVIAQELSSFGEVVVSGPQSAWTIDGSLDVGMVGLGVLRIEDGAIVTNEIFATIGTFPDDDVDFEDYDGGVGEVIVDGPGSTWAINGDLFVGLMSWGRWTLSSGGQIDATGDIVRGEWLPKNETPQTIIELSGSDDYTQPAIVTDGFIDGFAPRIDLIGGFVPRAGDVFVIASGEAGVEAFEFDLPELPPPLAWEVIQTSQTVELHVVDGLFGDLDGDGSVGTGDLIILLGAWGKCGDCAACPADLDDDCVVAGGDLILLLGNWDG